MIAFRATLDAEGATHLRSVLLSRLHGLLGKLSEFTQLCGSDQAQIINR